MDDDRSVKLAIYRHFATEASRPSPGDIASTTRLAMDDVIRALARLRTQRVLLLEPDGTTIRMAPPFSGVPTQHVAEVAGKRYFANCAWDALGIPAALQQSGIVHSRCEQSHEPLLLTVGRDGPEPTSWVFHCLVPAARWWDDLVYT